MSNSTEFTTIVDIRRPVTQEIERVSAEILIWKPALGKPIDDPNHWRYRHRDEMVRLNRVTWVSGHLAALTYVALFTHDDQPRAGRPAKKEKPNIRCHNLDCEHRDTDQPTNCSMIEDLVEVWKCKGYVREDAI